jgi:carbamoylphosphate synthase large subunit
VKDLLNATSLRGPLNIQLMGQFSTLIEINPRFGGGSTASLHAGWPALRWFLHEYALQRDVNEKTVLLRHVEVKRSWTDHVWEA